MGGGTGVDTVTVPLAVVVTPFSLKMRPEDIGVGVRIGEATTPHGEPDAAELAPDPPHAEVVRASTAKTTSLYMQRYPLTQSPRQHRPHRARCPYRSSRSAR